MSDLVDHVDPRYNSLKVIIDPGEESEVVFDMPNVAGLIWREAMNEEPSRHDIIKTEISFAIVRGATNTDGILYTRTVTALLSPPTLAGLPQHTIIELEDGEKLIKWQDDRWHDLAPHCVDCADSYPSSHFGGSPIFKILSRPPV